jgi:hypothetical protein
VAQVIFDLIPDGYEKSHVVFNPVLIELEVPEILNLHEFNHTIPELLIDPLQKLNIKKKKFS